MIKRESKKRRLDLHPLAAVVLAMVFATSALATKHIPSDLTIGTWDPVNRIYTLTTDVSETIGNAIEIDEDNLTLDGAGYTITSPGGMWWSHGVYLNGRTGVTIKNLNVETFSFSSGILLDNSSSNTLTANTISNNGIGIYLWGSSSGNTLTDNTALNNKSGILLNNSSNNNTLTNNTVASNSNRGISLGSSSNNNTLTGNTASNNLYGIWLDDSSGNTLTGNTVNSNNYEGIRLYDCCDNNTLTGNTVSWNAGYGIWLRLNSNDGNEIYNNNFIGNTTQARVDGGIGNVFNLAAPDGGGNYWSDYTGEDTDGDGIGETQYTFTGGVDDLPWVSQDGWVNQPPVANAGLDQTVECACQQGGTTVELNGSGSDDPDDDPLTYTWTGPFLGSPLSGPNPAPTVTLQPGCLGTYTISLVVNDGHVDSEPDTVTVIVQDTTPPVISLNGPASIILECGIDEYEEPGATASDNCDPTVSVVIAGDTVDTSICGTYIVTYNATDASGNLAIQVTRTVIGQDTTPPEITIVAPKPYGLYAAGDLALDFSAYDLVSGNIEPPALSGTLTDAAGYSGPVVPDDVPGPGVYTLVVSATDGAGNVAERDPIFFVVYDPSGGFVTGGGWIYSDPGAYVPDPTLEGKANFGFISKYKKGATEPTGQTEFVFHAGDLNFHSSSYDWLVVTGSDYAMFKGWGSINGYGDYRFMLWGGDNPDTFRIKIWWEDGDTENVVYDNGMDQMIDGGSIVVHAK